MKVTRKLAAEIRRAVIKKLGYSARCEVGQRVSLVVTSGTTYNAATFDKDESDLYDMCPLHELSKDEITESEGGIVELDLYCYYPRGHASEYDLDQNLSAFIVDGKFVEILSTEELIRRRNA